MISIFTSQASSLFMFLPNVKKAQRVKVKEEWESTYSKKHIGETIPDATIKFLYFFNIFFFFFNETFTNVFSEILK